MQLIDQIPLWGFFILTSVVVLLAIECGFRLGAFLRGRRKPEQIEAVSSKAPVGSIVQSTLALVAFVLAFTFGVASSRFNDRRVLIIDEANAIGTTYLRAAFLPEVNKQEIQNLLRKYVELRLKKASRDATLLKETLAESDRLQDSLWKQAVVIGKTNMDSDVIALFIASLNETIDLQSKRVAAFHARLPESIWLALYFMVLLGMASTGYQCGSAGARTWPATVALVASFAIVMTIIADLDRPTEGALRASKQPLVDLSRKIGPPTQ